MAGIERGEGGRGGGGGRDREEGERVIARMYMMMMLIGAAHKVSLGRGGRAATLM